MTTTDGGGASAPSRIVAFSPIRQNPQVLDLFLKHLQMQDVEIWGYDDNTDPESTRLLANSSIRILPELYGLPDASRYRRGEDTHHWDGGVVRRVAAIKNYAISQFLRTDFDALFLVDSDVLLPPGLIAHLDSAKVPIIASVYWSRWWPNLPEMANTWGTAGSHDFLRHPGHYEVPGLGACTLIRRTVFDVAQFVEPPHLATEGEDRWFCYHCHRAGIPLIMCSHLTPFHIYRDSQLDEARVWSDAHSRPAVVV